MSAAVSPAAPPPLKPALVIPPADAHVLRFGQAVAASGELLAIGEPAEGDAGAGSGAVHVGRLRILRSGARAEFELESVVPALEPGDGHGATIAIDDGPEAVLAIGAAQASASADLASCGAVRILARTTDAGRAQWRLVESLHAADPQPGADFGGAIAFGRIDGRRIVAIGAPRHDDGERFDAGLVEIFAERIGDGSPRWEPLALIRAPEPATSAWFGRAIAIGDGFLAVGAPGEPASGDTVVAAGAVHLFTIGASGASHAATLRHPEPAHAAWFGLALAADGARLLVGCPRARWAGIPVGDVASYLLASPLPTLPDRPTMLAPPVVQSGLGFGSALACADGLAIVGAIGCDAASGPLLLEDVGAVWAFDAEREIRLLPPESRPSVAFGASLAIARGGGEAALVAGHRYVEEEAVGPSPGVAIYLPGVAAPVLSADTTSTASASSRRPSRSR
ncbi:MAG: hypothetical protein ACKO0W_09050 [Planctomycetota bacterium]